ncbi:MAG: hypothetical protein IPM02_14190 [Betaproteobacteria bacterium]|nr:hypothetical protein [Betaproteobacteria bacterium]
MSRWQASGIHLGISAIVAAIVLGVLYLVWYPSSYFTAMGGEKLVYLLAGVDVALGPLITLIIFRTGKKGLVFDLAVIACLQGAALTYGVAVAAGARPVYTVFVVDRFEVVSANDLDPDEMAKIDRAEFKSLSWTGPRVVGVSRPADPDEQFRIIMSSSQGKDLQHFPQHFVPYADVSAEAGRRAQPLETLRRFNKERTGEIDAFVRQNGVREQDVGFLPLRAKRGERAAVVKRNGDIVGTLNLSPWGSLDCRPCSRDRNENGRPESAPALIDHGLTAGSPPARPRNSIRSRRWSWRWGS